MAKHNIFNIRSQEDIDNFNEYQVNEFLGRPGLRFLCNLIIERFSDPEWQDKSPKEKAKKMIRITGLSIGMPAALIILERLGLLSVLFVWWSVIWR